MSGRLSGKRIFLSASVPRIERAAEFLRPADRQADTYRRISHAPFEIEQAVVSLARAVFEADGQLVFGGHPSISPLLGMVAGEYRSRRGAQSEEGDARPFVLIYQSKAFEDYAPEATLLMFRLGMAHVEWTPAVAGERFIPGADAKAEICPESLALMRTKLLRETEPDAMVCIGGMEGVKREAALFSEYWRDRPIFVLRETGGAAALLADGGLPSVRVMDAEVMARVAERRRAFESSPTPGDHAGTGQPIIPYPLVMQTIVDEIGGTS